LKNEENLFEIFKAIPILPIEMEDHAKISEIALYEDITYYYTSYIYISLKRNEILVSDDKRMQEVAYRKIIVVKSSLELDLTFEE
jgi:predicted nucleic acid-binding protein